MISHQNHDLRHRKHKSREAPTPYTTQIQKEAQESELQYLSYGQKAKGIPPHFARYLVTWRRQIQKSSPLQQKVGKR